MRFIQNLLTIQTLTFIHRRFMSITPKEKEYNLKVLNNFIGYGNPAAKSWFMGIEEGGSSWVADDRDSTNLLEVYKNKFSNGPYHLNLEEMNKLNFSTATQDERSSYLDIVRELINDTKKGHRIVKNTDLGSVTGNEFLLNLSPLGFSSKDNGANHDYKNLFPIDNRDEFFNNSYNYYEDRISALKVYFDKYFTEGKYLFCFGNKYWNNFKDLLIKLDRIKNVSQFETKPFDIISRNNVNTFEEYTKDKIKIYLLYHPSYGWLTFEQIKSLLNNDNPS